MPLTIASLTAAVSSAANHRTVRTAAWRAFTHTRLSFCCICSIFLCNKDTDTWMDTVITVQVCNMNTALRKW